MAQGKPMVSAGVQKVKPGFLYKHIAPCVCAYVCMYYFMSGSMYVDMCALVISLFSFFCLCGTQCAVDYYLLCLKSGSII